ncbi:uncharacterized protein LOC135714132 [Ochlerotatus camptorhynchus]|uniref:uncharacterized protein LOC135714132 n=1 Tax=Ochlerotatus camptorhynchus TaxID=644619 RepID=UPI0031DA775F
MAQGKIKVKTKSIGNTKKPNKKGSAFISRKRAPVPSKKHKFEEAYKLKHVISKTVNQKNEDGIRKLVYEGQRNLSQAQQAVKEHHKKQGETQKAGTSTPSS